MNTESQGHSLQVLSIKTPLELIHCMVQGARFADVKDQVQWSAFAGDVWRRSLAAAAQVYDSTVSRSAQAGEIREAEQYCWKVDQQRRANVLHLCTGLVVDLPLVVAVIRDHYDLSNITLRYDGVMNLLVVLPMTADRKEAAGILIEALKAEGVEVYLGR